MAHVDAAGLPRIKDGAADGRRVEIVRADLVFIDEIVRAHGDPLDLAVVLAVILADLGAQIVRSLLVVCLGRQDPTQQPNHQFLG